MRQIQVDWRDGGRPIGLAAESLSPILQDPGLYHFQAPKSWLTIKGCLETPPNPSFAQNRFSQTHLLTYNILGAIYVCQSRIQWFVWVAVLLRCA